MTVEEYYADAAVQTRIREYAGGVAGGALTAAFLATLGPPSAAPLMWESAVRWPAPAFDGTWPGDADVVRSLRDRESLIFLLEVDYLNPDRPATPFFRSAEVFARLEPAYRAVRDALESYAVYPFVLMTGRGYHFTGRIPLGHPVIEDLATIGESLPGWTPWMGLGCLIEYAAHRVMQSWDRTDLPLVFNGTVVGRGGEGRECASLDFSYVGDPIDVRFVRTAFSAYQWHRLRPDLFGGAAARLPPLVALPRGAHPLAAVLERGRTLEAGRQLAHESSGGLPDVSPGITRLFADYRDSQLAQFHRHFHAGLRVAVPGPLPVDLPPCVMAGLSTPNDLLLKPEHIQHLTRMLLARGWPAARIARLLQQTYDADHHWGDRWTRRMNPAQRAQFDVRVFAGRVATGTDSLVDFNCVSAQEKGLCPRATCTHDLRRDRARLELLRP